MKKILAYRRYVQLFFALLIYAALTYLHIGLGIIFAISLVLGVIFGKVFCKWMCPMGFIMELMTRSMSPEQKQNHMYNYYNYNNNKLLYHPIIRNYNNIISNKNNINVMSRFLVETF